MVTIQHFVFVRSTSSLLLPSNGCVQNWNRPFSPPLSSLHFSHFFFFLRSAPSFTPSHTVSYKHTLVLTHTCIQTTSCLLCTDKSPLLLGTHSLDYYYTNFCSSSHVLGHTQHYKYSTWLVAGCQAGTIVQWTDTKLLSNIIHHLVPACKKEVLEMIEGLKFPSRHNLK